MTKVGDSRQWVYFVAAWTVFLIFAEFVIPPLDSRVKLNSGVAWAFWTGVLLLAVTTTVMASVCMYRSWRRHQKDRYGKAYGIVAVALSLVLVGISSWLAVLWLEEILGIAFRSQV